LLFIRTHIHIKTDSPELLTHISLVAKVLKAGEVAVNAWLSWTNEVGKKQKSPFSIKKTGFFEWAVQDLNL